MKIEEFKVETWINKYENSCTFDFTNTCVGVLSVAELAKLSENPGKVVDDILDIKLGYGRVPGTERLRHNIAGLYNNAMDFNIVVTHGAIGANSLAMISLLEKDDEVITFLPIYQQHYSIPESVGAKVKKIYLREENNWQIDFDELKSVISNKTKMIFLNNPNNPTGKLFDEKTLEDLSQIARKYGTYILCDEVYRGLNHIGKPFTKSIFDIYERGISTGSMSKTFSLPGLRLGWIVAPSDIVEKINIQRNYHVICIGRINDYLASIALENKDKIVSRNNRICRENIEMFDSWLSAEPHLSYIKPHAGTTVFVKYDMKIPSEILCQKLQQDTGIMILPGSTMEYENFLRIGYTNEKESVKSALTEFSRWLSTNFY